jgi:signal transduction histidine kinase
MKRLTLRTAIYLALDVALAVACILHLPSLRQLAQAPFAVKESEGHIFVAEPLQPPLCPDLHVGDELLSLRDHRVTAPEVVEFLTHSSSVDEWVLVGYRRSGETFSATVKLGATNSMEYVLLVAFIGLVTWCLGVFVLLMRPLELRATILHWAMISMAVVVVIAFDDVTPHSVLGYVSSLLFFVSYAGVATTFLLFTTVFPRDKQGPVWLKLLIIYVPAVTLLVPIIYHHWRAFSLLSVEEYMAFQRWFDVFHVALFAYVGGGILSFIHSYVTSASTAERKQLKWILWGLCVGPTPFLLLAILPKFVAPEYAVPEEYTLASLVIIPIAFAIACIKHHVLDVEIVLNRTTAYAIVLGVLVGIYIGVVAGVASFIGSTTASAGAAVVVALLFQPLRTKVQQFVDKRFFRVRYNFRNAQRRIMEEIKYCLDIHRLGEVVVGGIDGVIPVERIGFFVLKMPGNRVQLVTHKGFDLLETHGVQFDAAHLKTQLQLPVAIASKVEPGIPHESADAVVFQRWGMTLVFAMMSEKQEFLGFLVLGEKKSGARFTGEDVDLLSAIAAQAGAAIERVTLQQQLVLQQAEAQRLEELNQLKSDFVSYVSHELKTPLTSIKMFAELLRSRSKKSDGKVLEYLQIIEGEADRLDRMVSTILDSAKIEEGVKEYRFSEVDLREVAGRVMDMMKYQLDKHGFRVVFDPGGRPLVTQADEDAVAQAIINLVSNAIKYSFDRKYLKVLLRREGSRIRCSVQDRGPGISTEARPHLFEKFYRDPQQSVHTQGVGLGLPLVKHIMEAHGGSVEVESELGKGSIFTLSFVVRQGNHESEKKDSDR